MTLWRKTYISTARISDTEQDLHAILETSRTQNASCNVTGVLLISGGSFYQTLEGDRGPVEATFKRIRHDRRHDGLIVLQDEECKFRAFAEWSMAHRDLPAEHNVSTQIARIDLRQPAAFRTGAAAAELDLLIKTFLTV